VVVVQQDDGANVQTLSPDRLARQARAARGQVENALGSDVRRWPFTIGASRLIDLWIVLEERDE
jgi:hypothetical protein